MRAMLGGLTSIRANVGGLKSRRAMLDTLLRHLPMVRLSVGALAVMALVGCTGRVDDGGNSENLTPEQQPARLKWEQKAYPVLSVNCQGCHAGSTVGVAFLAGADAL